MVLIVLVGLKNGSQKKPLNYKGPMESRRKKLEKQPVNIEETLEKTYRNRLRDAQTRYLLSIYGKARGFDPLPPNKFYPLKSLITNLLKGSIKNGEVGPKFVLFPGRIALG